MDFGTLASAGPLRWLFEFAFFYPIVMSFFCMAGGAYY